MSGCCLYCKYAESFWIDREGKYHRPPKSSFGDMNIWCHQPEKGRASSATRSHSQGARFLNVTQTSVLNAGERFSRNLIDTASTLS